MAVWNTATPAGSDPRSQGDDRIRELKTAIQDALRGGEADGVEAVFPGAAPTTDPVFHYRGQKGAQAARPAATEAGLFYNETTGTLQRANGSTWDDLTENAAFEAIHHKVGASLASISGVITLPETGNSFNVSGTEAVTSIAGWSAGVVIIKWDSARTLTQGGSLVLKGGASRKVTASDISIFEFTGSNAVREVAVCESTSVATRTIYLTGSGNYTTPDRVRQIRVRVVAGGGGGAGPFTGGTGHNGSVGSDSSFNSIVAKGGSGGHGVSGDYSGGAGGTGGSGTASLRAAGNSGCATPNGSGNVCGSTGGGSAFFGGGAVGTSTNGNAGIANTGGGGAGGAYQGIATSGGGGGGGESLEYIVAPTAAQVFAYVVGAGGAGGAADTSGGAGGDGGSGIIVIDEIY